MIRLSNERARAIEEALPPDTVAFLRDSGVPELVVFRGIEHAFTLDMEPVLDGGAFRLGSVDRGSYAMGVRQKTGHFGYVFTEPEEPSWVFCNSDPIAHVSARFDRSGMEIERADTKERLHVRDLRDREFEFR